MRQLTKGWRVASTLTGGSNFEFDTRLPSGGDPGLDLRNQRLCKAERLPSINALDFPSN